MNQIHTVQLYRVNQNKTFQHENPDIFVAQKYLYIIFFSCLFNSQYFLNLFNFATI